MLKKASTGISDETICSITEREVKRSSFLKGYQNIWNNWVVSQCPEMINLLRCIDPTNSAMRQTKTIGKVSLVPYKHN